MLQCLVGPNLHTCEVGIRVGIYNCVKGPNLQCNAGTLGDRQTDRQTDREQCLKDCVGMFRFRV